MRGSKPSSQQEKLRSTDWTRWEYLRHLTKLETRNQEKPVENVITAANQDTILKNADYPEFTVMIATLNMLPEGNVDPSNLEITIRVGEAIKEVDREETEITSETTPTC